ncbi:MULTISPECIES: hypothetical protein [unclassified Vibrio]|uniref:hypothetical protein n=1 Tax=unclassified Vibrio TaxID=2614977 RepID=UPI001360EC6D|nr:MULTISPECIES: hypothetical protein [unclassified Vibrio]NAW58492.1 hypothetical protein [Vibrio sp. V36_P2S2PM302]NAX24964.1 hypothetical protein [Vibrio sp. V38_P2S17PM301]NAX32564.1 hypothetical protein [Vibrio sp. V37_P2S8PM304]
MHSPLTIKSPEADIRQAINTIKLMQLTPVKKRRVIRRVGKAVIRDAKQNIRQQTDIHGKAFAKRKGRSKKKLLKNLARPLSDYVMADRVRVDYFKNRGAGNIAYEQQHGTAEDWTAAKLKKIRSKSKNDSAKHYQDPATRQQAKRLIDAGFTVVRKSGKGRKKPSVKWITDNLTQGQFGAIYRDLTGDKPKKTWKIQPPERAFLGMDNKAAQKRLAQELINVTTG